MGSAVAMDWECRGLGIARCSFGVEDGGDAEYAEGKNDGMDSKDSEDDIYLQHLRLRKEEKHDNRYIHTTDSPTSNDLTQECRRKGCLIGEE